MTSNIGASKNSSIPQVVEQPGDLEQPTQAELDAIIKEARARARRRRLTVAAVLIGVLILLAIGWWGLGGGGDASPGPDDAGGSALGAASASQTASDPCPPQPVPKTTRTKSGGFRTAVPMCELTVNADLPDGWIQRGRKMSQITEFNQDRNEAPLFFSGIPTSGVTFTTVAPHTGAGLGSGSSFPLPKPDDMAIQMVPVGPGEDPGKGRDAERPLQVGDFQALPVSGRVTKARTNLYRSGWQFQLLARAGSAPVDETTLAEANALLDSITVDERLIPAGSG